MSRSAALIPLLAAGLLAGLAACTEAPEAPQAEDYSSLLSDLGPEGVKRLREVRNGRELGKDLETCLPTQVDFAPDIYTAIERATKENKPIFLTSVVTKGGVKRPDCDV